MKFSFILTVMLFAISIGSYSVSYASDCEEITQIELGHGGGHNPVHPGPIHPPRPVHPSPHRPGYDHPYPIHHGHHPWPHWNHHWIPRPVYYWDWEHIHWVTCTAEDSSGYLYPVTEDGYFGEFQSRLEQIEDAALDRCYEESHGDEKCWLVGCESGF